MKGFEQLEVWKTSSDLCFDLYERLRGSREFWIKDQILRSALSVPSNIAEGCDRRTSREFIQFLGIARGSCAELRSQLLLLNRIQKNSSDNTIENFIDETMKISAMLTKLIQYRQKS